MLPFAATRSEKNGPVGRERGASLPGKQGVAGIGRLLLGAVEAFVPMWSIKRRLMPRSPVKNFQHSKDYTLLGLVPFC